MLPSSGAGTCATPAAAAAASAACTLSTSKCSVTPGWTRDAAEAAPNCSGCGRSAKAWCLTSVKGVVRSVTHCEVRAWQGHTHKSQWRSQEQCLPCSTAPTARTAPGRLPCRRARGRVEPAHFARTCATRQTHSSRPRHEQRLPCSAVPQWRALADSAPLPAVPAALPLQRKGGGCGVVRKLRAVGTAPDVRAPPKRFRSFFVRLMFDVAKPMSG